MRVSYKSVVSAAALALPIAFVGAAVPAVAGSSQSAGDCIVNHPCGGSSDRGALILPWAALALQNG